MTQPQLTHWFCCNSEVAVCSTVTTSGVWVAVSSVDCVVCKELAVTDCALCAARDAE